MKSLRFPQLIRTDEWEGYELHDIRRFLKPSGHWLEFNNWFHGKTGGITNSGEYCVYKKDFDKFLTHIGLSIG